MRLSKLKLEALILPHSRFNSEI